MLYDPSTSAALHAWLVKTLEPICDAEPEALATYISALLKNDVLESELRNEIVKQLDEFFENGATAFVDTLFAALRSKSYVPYTSTPATYTPTTEKKQDAGIPIPLDALLTSPIPTSPGNSRKRSHEDEDRDVRGPPKGPRLGNDAYFARHGYGNDNGQADTWQRDGPRGEYGMNGHGPRPYQQQNGRPMLPRGVCRDYHLKGFCSRGAMCKYSHDDAAIAPQMPFGGPPQMTGNMSFMPMYGGMPFGLNGVPSQGYDPNDAHMDMRSRQHHPRVPTMPRADGEAQGLLNAHGELPVVQDLTPATSGKEGIPMDGVAPSDTPVSSVAVAGPSDAHLQSFPSAPLQPSPTVHHQSSTPGVRPPKGGNAAYRGRGRGGRGTFGEHQSFGDQNENKTIVVEKIPEEHLSLEAVNNWFKRFGTVTNVAVDVTGGKALVSFSTHDEAFAAWKAEEAVFNNRFVKIFWHRPLAGQGAAGARALQASAPLVANIASRETAPPVTAENKEPPKPLAVTTAGPPKPKPSNPVLAAIAAKQQLLEKQIAEQKELMAKLSKATPEEKKDIIARLKKLNSEMKSPIAPAASSPAATSEDDKEKKKKMLLDLELDMHAKATEEPAPAENGEETNENLQEKLARLREEAKALGIHDVASQAYAPAVRGYRGRRRGRGAFRGAIRGGPPRISNMKLDNRPKALLIKCVSSHDPEVVQSVRTFYEAAGPVASIDVVDSDSLVARFPSRAIAEQAFAKGSNIPSVDNAKISWFTDTQPAKPAVPTPVVENKKVALVDERPPSPRSEDVHLPDDSGWGDEDGMGMF